MGRKKSKVLLKAVCVNLEEPVLAEIDKVCSETEHNRSVSMNNILNDFFFPKKVKK